MANETTIQRLGRRLDVVPYYRVVRDESGMLELESLATANRGPGMKRLLLGTMVMLIGLLVVVSGSLSRIGGGDFALAAVSAVVGGLIASWGFRLLAGGYAIVTTQNRIMVDDQAVEYRQNNRLAGERRQRIDRSMISGVRLRRRPLLRGRIVKRMQPIVVLELIVGSEIWIVDSAVDAEDLRATAEALSEVLGKPLGGEPHTQQV